MLIKRHIFLITVYPVNSDANDLAEGTTISVWVTFDKVGDVRMDVCLSFSTLCC